MGIATKTGPKTKIMENSRLSLTLVGYGSTSVNPLTNIPKTARYINNATRKTVVKVIFLIKNFLVDLYYIKINLKVFSICYNTLKERMYLRLVYFQNLTFKISFFFIY